METKSPTLESNYIDYEVYLEGSFNPIAFANTLVQATNSIHDMDIDLTTPSKRLKYDLEEVEQRISKMTSDNYQELISKASSATMTSQILPPIQTSLDHVNSSYAKLQRDILTPFYKADNIHTALRRLHSTSGLLRSLTWYLYLARQLATLLKPIKGPSAVPDNPRNARQANLNAIEPKNVLQAARTILEIQTQLKTEPGLRSLQVIRTHEASLSKNEQKLIKHCQNILTFYSSSITNSSNFDSDPISRSSSPAISNSSNFSDLPPGLDYDSLLSHACYSLFLLKPDTLSSSIQKFHVSQVRAAINPVSRSLSSLNVSFSKFHQAIVSASERVLVIYKLDEILKSASSSSDEETKISLWNFISSSLDVKNLTDVFWKDIARNLENQIRDFVHNNPNMTKSIRGKNYPTSVEIVKRLTVSPFVGTKFESAIPNEGDIKHLEYSLGLLFK